MKAKVLCKFNKKQANERIYILRFSHKLKILQRLTRTIASSWAWVALCVSPHSRASLLLVLIVTCSGFCGRGRVRISVLIANVICKYLICSLLQGGFARWRIVFLVCVVTLLHVTLLHLRFHTSYA